MENIQVTLSGFEDLQARLVAAGPAAVNAVAGALYREALSVFAASQVLVPVDTGALRASGGVSPPDVQATTVNVEIGYGGSAAPYALWVHEITTSYHLPPTQAKFLEQPVLEAVPGMEGRLAADITTELSI